MNQTKHTPGPWTVSQGLRHIISADDQIVADMRGIFKPPLNTDTPTRERRQHIAEHYQQQETEANARLIVEAPAMRELLAEQATISCECDDIPGACNPCRSRALLARIGGDTTSGVDGGMEGGDR